MSQRERLLFLLQEHGGWVDLRSILELRIAQYSARIKELRDAGYRIENRIERRNGRIYSWFRLMPREPVQRELELCGTGGGRKTSENWSA